MKVINKVPTNIKVAILGSTYMMYALNCIEDLNINAFNFAMDAQSIEIDNLLIHKYADNISEGAFVIMGFAACVSFFRYDMVNDKSKYYSIFKPNELPDYKFTKNIKRIFSISNLKNKIRSFIFNDIYTSYCPAVETGNTTQNERIAKMKAMADGWICLFGLHDLKHKDISPQNIANRTYNTNLLMSIVEFCLQRKWHPIFVIPPFSEALNNHFSDEFLANSIYDMLNKVANKYRVPIFDYRISPAFQKDFAAYSDGGFRMSKYGSRKFTQILLSDLNKKGFNLTNYTLRNK